MIQLFLTTKPRRTNPRGLFFVCFCSSQSSDRRTLFHYFSINIDCLFALAGYLIRYHRAVNLKFIDYKNSLFYDCFYSGFTFYGYCYISCRNRDSSFAGSDYCACNRLAKNVADNNLLTFGTCDNYCAIDSLYRE